MRASVDGGHRIRGQLLAEHFDDPPGGQRAVGRDAQRGQRALAVHVDVGGGPLREAFGEPRRPRSDESPTQTALGAP